MCPLSAMTQLFVVLLSLLLICHSVIVKAQEWKLSVSSTKPTIHMHDAQTINFNVTGPDEVPVPNMYSIITSSKDKHIASVNEKQIWLKNDGINQFYTGNFSITGNFLGQTKVLLKLVKNGYSATKNLPSLLEQNMDVVVVRKKRVIDTVFTASVATLVAIIYVNFGCALKWSELRTTLKRPIGPAIGFVGQFLVMPVLSFVLAKLLFPDNPEMQLGIFFTGCSPGGGASNVWAAILDGNIDLSITMTTISTFAAFGMMPLWIFTLGGIIFEQAKLGIPYNHIMTYALALVVPLFIGFLIQRYLKRISQFLVRILKIFSTLIILFIIVFAIITNLYLFELFSWQIVIAGMGLPWLGYALAWFLAKALRQPPRDALTIAIETGIQNTGIAIFLLRFALPQPQADLTTVAPVAVAIMTPFPLLAIFIYIKLKARFWPDTTKTSKLLNGSGYAASVDGDNHNTISEVKNGFGQITVIS